MISIVKLSLFLVVTFFMNGSYAQQDCMKIVSIAEKGDISAFILEANEIKKYKRYEECGLKILDFWRLNLEKYPFINKVFLLNDDVRVEIASILFRSVNVENANLEKSRIIKYVRNIDSEKQCAAFSKGLIILSSTKDPLDQNIILKEIYKGKPCSFRAAVLSLVMRCDVDEVFINEVKSKIIDHKNREFLKNTWVKYNGFRGRICLGE